MTSNKNQNDPSYSIYMMTSKRRTKSKTTNPFRRIHAIEANSLQRSGMKF